MFYIWVSQWNVWFLFKVWVRSEHLLLLLCSGRWRSSSAEEAASPREFSLLIAGQWPGWKVCGPGTVGHGRLCHCSRESGGWRLWVTARGCSTQFRYGAASEVERASFREFQLCHGKWPQPDFWLVVECKSSGSLPGFRRAKHCWAIKLLPYFLWGGGGEREKNLHTTKITFSGVERATF